MHTKPTLLSLALLFSITTTTTQASVVYANSELSMEHSYLVNSGNLPQGLDIVNVPQTLVINNDLVSSVDSADFVNNRTIDVQIGNPFDEPPTPYINRGVDTTINLANADFATAMYEHIVASDDEGDSSAQDIISRSVNQEGQATIALNNDSYDSLAYSSVLLERHYRLDNTGNDAISFNISGLFEASMSASVDSEDAIARTSGGFELIFEPDAGSSVQYFPIAPYLTDIEDSDDGASVTELFLANSGGIEGVLFNGSTTAIGDNSGTMAQLMAQSRYIFGISIAAGESVLMRTGFRQTNSVEYIQQVNQVPVAGSLLLFICGLVGIKLPRKS